VDRLSSLSHCRGPSGPPKRSLCRLHRQLRTGRLIIVTSFLSGLELASSSADRLIPGSGTFSSMHAQTSCWPPPPLHPTPRPAPIARGSPEDRDRPEWPAATPDRISRDPLTRDPGSPRRPSHKGRVFRRPRDLPTSRLLPHLPRYFSRLGIVLRFGGDQCGAL